MTASRARNFTVFLVSCAIFISMMMALGSRRVGIFEGPVRLTAGLSELIVVPILLVLSSRDWLSNQRKSLPAWRNGLGCSSIAVLTAIWVLLHTVILLSWLAPRAGHIIDEIEWIGTFLMSSILAFGLGFALRGAARVYAISSALLLFAGIQSMIYV